MILLRQLYLLLWKNVVLKRTAKIRITIEIIGPLFLFMILLAVRLRNLRLNIGECYFVERPLPSSGLLPFARSYICELNNSCYNTSINNNYDQVFLTQLQEVAVNISEHLNKFQNIQNLFTTTPNLINLINQTLNSQTNNGQIGNLNNLVSNSSQLQNQLINTFPSNINSSLVNLLLNSQPDFNQILNIIPLSTVISSNTNNSNVNLTNNQVNNLQQLGCNNSGLFIAQQPQITNLFCSLNNTQFSTFTNIIQSSLLNLTGLQQLTAQTNPQVSTNLLNLQEALTKIAPDLTAFQDLANYLSNDSTVHDLVTNFNFSKALCGDSQLSLLSVASSLIPSKVNLTMTPQYDYLNFTNTSYDYLYPTNTSSSGEIDIVSYLNTIANLNGSDCPYYYDRTCLCGAVNYFLSQSNLINYIWQQIEAIIVGKILYAPNTTYNNEIIKRSNFTFNTMANLKQIFESTVTLLKQIEEYQQTYEQLQVLLEPNLPDLTTFFEQVKSFEQVLQLSNNFMACFDMNKFVGYKTEDEATRAGMDLISKNLFWGAVIFENTSNETEPSLVKYKIRMNPYMTHDTFYTKDRYYKYGPNSCLSCNADTLYGYIYIQDMIEKGIIEMQTNNTQSFGITTQMTPYPCYVQDLFMTSIENTMPLFMVLAWIFTVSMIVKDIVYEKEKRIKEFMRVMGLSNGIHWSAWFITSFISMFIVCIFLCLILKYGNITGNSDLSCLLVIFTCFTISTITQCFLISTFFNRANLAAAVAGIAYFVLYLPYMILKNYASQLQSYQQFLASLSSTCAFGYICELMSIYELQNIGINWQTFYETPYSNGGLTCNYLCLIMLFDSFLYMLFTWYIENIAPGEFGIARPFYFPFQPSYWSSNVKSNKTKKCVSSNEEEKRSSGFSSFIKEKFSFASAASLGSVSETSTSSNEKVGIEIINLNKIYSRGNHHAVKNLSVKFNENEITAFLGHNGAGKSTTMHILTGLYSPTSGTAKINGLDITENMNDIRRSLGFVPQHNILFDAMSVENHLWFYARLKGLECNDTLAEMDKLLSDTGLVNKRNAFAKTLSGGMKRKLSVAIAFVGGSKIVLLDEPSAGVDPKGRRGIWDLLFKNKEGRTIVVSTHHMDEADILSDNIVIIANGRLITSGTNYSLKQKHGRGYYLTLAKKQPNLDDGLKQVDVDMPQKYEAAGDDDGKLVSSPQDEKIHEFIMKRFNGAKLIENYGWEMKYSISNKLEDTKEYSRLFNELEQNQVQLGICSVGISDTSLEEIFVKLAQQPDLRKDKDDVQLSWMGRIKACMKNMRIENGEEEKRSYDITKPTDDPNVKTDNPINTEVLKKYTNLRINKFYLLIQQLYALLIKRFHRVKRNMKGFVAEIVLPVIFVCLALLAATLSPKQEQRPSFEIHPWYYNDINYIFLSEQTANSNLKNMNEVSDIVNTFYNKPSLGTRCLDNHQIAISNQVDRFRSQLSSTRLKCLENNDFLNLSTSNIPQSVINQLQSTNYSYTGVSPSCSCKSTGFPICPDGAGGDIDYRQTVELKTYDILLNLTQRNISDWVVKTEFNEKYFQKRYGGYEFINQLFTNESNIRQVINTTQMLLNITINDFNDYINNKRIKIWYNNKGYYAHVAYLNVLNNALLRNTLSKTSANINNYGIVSYNHPMNFTSNQLALQIMAQAAIDLFVAICIIFALSFIPASFLVFLLEERESHSKQLQFVSGIKPYMYWISNFIWDLFNYVVPCIICIVIFFIFNATTYIASQNIICVILLMLLYGWACIPLMYPLNYLFKIPSTAFVMSSCLNVFIGMVTTISTTVIDQLKVQQPDLAKINNILKPTFIILFPHYCLGRGFIDVSILYNTAQANSIIGVPINYSALDYDKCGMNLLAMAIQGCVYFLFNLFLQYKFFIRIKPPNIPKEFHVSQSEDDDVRNERERILASLETKKVNKKQQSKDETALQSIPTTTNLETIPNPDVDYVKLVNLTKVYRKFSKYRFKNLLAVKSLCLGINKGECFGLIGVNGAGKTTTFKMLTGDVQITSGDATINNFSVSKQIEKVHKNLGYCPQFDVIFPLLTAREHLLFYARLRGIPELYCKNVTIWALNRVGLFAYADRLAGDFSGGNKRKLSTAIALVGDPGVICLDEPTSGMDAKARRLLWDDILSLIKENRIVILTSHSMEECETLCTRLVIMVNGEFKCLGSPQYLKTKFGNGFKLKLRLVNESMTNRLYDFMRNNFPLSSVTEKHKNLIEFTLPFHQTKLSKIFGLIETNREFLNIKDYSVGQTTLDQVFVNFAKMQDEDSKLTEISEDYMKTKL